MMLRRKNSTRREAFYRSPSIYIWLTFSGQPRFQVATLRAEAPQNLGLLQTVTGLNQGD
jgi:hypothetical protein